MDRAGCGSHCLMRTGRGLRRALAGTARTALLRDRSGRGGGDGRGGVERVDWWFADVEAEDLEGGISFHTQPVPGAAGLAVLLLAKCLPAAGFFPHQPVNAAAEPVHDVEQLVPEGAVAEAWDHGEIQADVEDGTADG